MSLQCHNAPDLPAWSHKLLPLCMKGNRLKIGLLFNSNATRIHPSIQLGCYLLSYLHFAVSKEFVCHLCSFSKTSKTKNRQEFFFNITHSFIKASMKPQEHFSGEDGGRKQGAHTFTGDGDLLQSTPSTWSFGRLSCNSSHHLHSKTPAGIGEHKKRE